MARKSANHDPDRPYPIVEVIWEDHAGAADTTWESVETFIARKTDSASCRLVGYLLWESEDRYGIAAALTIRGPEELGDHPVVQVGGCWQILKGSVVSIKTIAP